MSAAIERAVEILQSELEDLEEQLCTAQNTVERIENDIDATKKAIATLEEL